MSLIFFFGLGVEQQLGAGLEAVGADREHRVLGQFVLAQLGADTRQQHPEAERLGDVIVGARIEPENGVGLGIGAGQHDDRGFQAVAPEQTTDLAAVHVGQADIEQDQIESLGFGELEDGGGGIGLEGFEFLVQPQLLGERFPQRLVILDQEYAFFRTRRIHIFPDAAKAPASASIPDQERGKCNPRPRGAIARTCARAGAGVGRPTAYITGVDKDSLDPRNDPNRTATMADDLTDTHPIDAVIPAAVFAVDRAIGDLRRGGTVVLIDDAGGASLVLSTEYATASRLAALAAEPGGPVSLAITPQRAQALGLSATSGPAIAMALPEPLDVTQIHDLSDPTAPKNDLASEMADLVPSVPQARDAAAVVLAKLGNLLPAVLTRSLDEAAIADLDDWIHQRDLVRVGIADIAHHRDRAATALDRVSAARVPLADAEDATIVAFRPSDGGTEHLAIVIGEPLAAGEPVMVRLHSQCFTGDLIGSLRCDCGDQLRGAVRHIGAVGAGIILYLAQEGRGIGLVNKLRAYTLQDQGLDTFEANEQLGFDADERHYLVAAEMLRQLGFSRIRLLTNNPEKIAALQRSGIDVVERVPHAFPANGHNERYLATKASRGGHLI